MPRRRAAPPPRPANLPPLPPGATTKAYYPAGDRVWYMQDENDEGWTRGTIDPSTTSTRLHYVADDETGDVYAISVEYICLRASWD
ncbi:hypothetical protein B0T14DRAFT_565987 [Immersiella caudata]|uniref:Uncharacterized protein n=1 Tax=Immersiella caudata TaxID=314043 RepID=A0AA39WPE4_9PEZI|nr:hypothetical protein B0T14DRAFT_565987 [Immersiella caudata]